MAKRKPTKDEMLQELVMLDRVTSALNNAIVSLMYICKVKGTELDKVTGEKYVEFVTKHVHPLMKQTDRLVKEVAEKTKMDLDKQITKAEEEKK